MVLSTRDGCWKRQRLRQKMISSAIMTPGAPRFMETGISLLDSVDLQGTDGAGRLLRTSKLSCYSISTQPISYFQVELHHSVVIKADRQHWLDLNTALHIPMIIMG